MATIVIEVVGANELRNKMSQLQVELPQALHKDSKEIMKMYRKSFRCALERRNIKSNTGRLRRFRTIKDGKNGYRMEMPEYGHFLDAAKGHWVPMFKPNKAKGAYAGNVKYAVDWAKRTGFPDKFLWVKGKRWLRLGTSEARKGLKIKIGEGYTTKLIRRKVT